MQKSKRAVSAGDSPITEVLNKAMTTNPAAIVWIKYTAGTNPGTVRSIQPMYWEVHNWRIKALCRISNTPKSFYVARMAAARFEPWE